ncbi:MAG: response regulator [Flavobacteriaceae bacterium]
MKKVLLIEDDIVLRENIAELLELSDFEVFEASNGKTGIEKAKTIIPNIIVCDIMMPELDGYEVLKELSKNKKTKYIPFIFLSAKTEHKDVRKGMDLGADDYITKPFNEEELINAIDSRLAKASILEDMRNEFSKNSSEKDVDKIKTLQDLKNFFYDNGEYFNYSTNDIIYKEGYNSNYIYLINKGAVKCFKFEEHGKELITALYKQGDLFGYTSFEQNIPYQETATAVKEVELIGITKKELNNVLVKNHKLTLEFIQILTDDLREVKDDLLQMAYSSVNKKTAATILKFAEKLNRKPEDPIKISRSDLASVAGIATETLIRTMTNFRKQGIITIEGRNIKILDVQKLKHIE